MKTKRIAGIVLIAASITWGCNQSGSEEQKSSGNDQVQQKEQVKAGQQQKAPAAKADEFGRKPGEAHYGHSHSSSEPHSTKPANAANAQQAPASGEPDKFGRKPGDPHYGHNHQ